MNRRHLLGAMGAVAGAFPFALDGRTMAAPFFARHRLPIGLQLFPLGAMLRADLDGTLARVSAIGYRRVELAGLPGRSAADVRAALDRHGLECRSMHVPAQPWFGPGPSLDRGLDVLIADAHAIGADAIVMPLFLFREFFDQRRWPDTLAFLRSAGAALTPDDFTRTAAFLNEKAAALHGHGLGLLYHNHNFEFAPLAGGGTGLDMLLAQTDPARVGFELDVGWAAAAGVDLAALLLANPGRFTKLHVKDIAADNPVNTRMEQRPADVGAGTIDWKRLLPVAHAAGARDFYVEREAPFAGDPMAAMAASYRYLATLATA